jgi:hypothetical protein
MGIHRWGVRLDDALSPVARRAVPSGGVVLLVTRGAGHHGLFGLQGHRRDVALGARHAGMRRVLEPDLPGARRLPRKLHRDGDRPQRLDLRGLMAGGTVRLGGTLVMTDLAAAGRLEGEIAGP